MAAIPAGEDRQTDESITTIIRAHIKLDKVEEYEQWLHGINEDATQFGGFEGPPYLKHPFKALK